MRALVCALAALGMMTVQAAAQATKPAVGSEEIYWVVTVAIPPGQMDSFKEVVAPLVAATKEEPGAMQYEYAASPDQSTVDIYERYRDSPAVIAHLTQTFGPKFSKQFLAIAKPTRFIVYGTPSPEAQKVLAGFDAIYMTPFDGFTREEPTASGSTTPGK